MIEIVYDRGDGVELHYTMPGKAEQMLREFSEGIWSEVRMVEVPPEIRRNLPAAFTIKRSEHDQPAR